MRKFSKRTLAIGLPLAAITIAGVAYAATVAVSSTSLGSGDAAVNACNSAASVTYDSTYDATAGKYDVSTVNLTTATACATKHYQITLSGAGNAVLGSELTGTLDAAGSASATATGVAAADVTGVHVLITD